MTKAFEVKLAVKQVVLLHREAVVLGKRVGIASVVGDHHEDSNV